MRLSPLYPPSGLSLRYLPVVLIALVLASTAHAAPQDMRSPDARDANVAVNAQTLQDIAKAHRESPKDAALLAQERYYSSYGKAAPSHAPATHHSAPLPDIVIGLGLIVLVAGSVAVAVRTRRRTVRVAV